MGTNLYYRIISEGKDLSDELKYKLQRAFVLPHRFDSSHVLYLRGLADCGVKDARRLIELIDKHDEVEVFEQ